MKIRPRVKEISKAVKAAKIALNDKYSKTLNGPNESEKKLNNSRNRFIV